MIKDIVSYIEHLRSAYGLKISIHGKALFPHLDSLAPYNAHENAYCMYVKTLPECRKRCRTGQCRAEMAAELGEFFGSCYAGVAEYVFPIVKFGKTVGIISVGAFLGSSEKRSAFAEKYGFAEEKLTAVAERELQAEIPDKAFVRTIIAPLSAMLTLLLEKSLRDKDGDAEIYGKILSILHTGYTEKLSIADIAAACHYSPSFVSRHFRRKSGKSVCEYLAEIRLGKAKELLLFSSMSIGDIAAAVGFSDANYFISFFSHRVGISPKKFRTAEAAKDMNALG